MTDAVEDILPATDLRYVVGTYFIGMIVDPDDGRTSKNVDLLLFANAYRFNGSLQASFSVLNMSRSSSKAQRDVRSVFFQIFHEVATTRRSQAVVDTNSVEAAAYWCVQQAFEELLKQLAMPPVYFKADKPGRGGATAPPGGRGASGASSKGTNAKKAKTEPRVATASEKGKSLPLAAGKDVTLVPVLDPSVKELPKLGKALTDAIAKIGELHRVPQTDDDVDEIKRKTDHSLALSQGL